MKEYPINFKPEEVRAILGGRKTQMRMIIKPQPIFKINKFWYGGGFWHHPKFSWAVGLDGKHKPGQDFLVKAPYPVGSRIWVREPWQVWVDYNGLSSRELPQLIDVLYIADRPDSLWDSRKRRADSMPRWASRLNLEIIDVRVERLHDITEEDAIAEGMKYHDGRGIGHSGYRHSDSHGFVYETAKQSFQIFWDKAHRRGAWDCNDWVWVYDFEVVNERD